MYIRIQMPCPFYVCSLVYTVYMLRMCISTYLHVLIPEVLGCHCLLQSVTGYETLPLIHPVTVGVRCVGYDVIRKAWQVKLRLVPFALPCVLAMLIALTHART